MRVIHLSIHDLTGSLDKGLWLVFGCKLPKYHDSFDTAREIPKLYSQRHFQTTHI